MKNMHRCPGRVLPGVLFVLLCFWSTVISFAQDPVQKQISNDNISGETRYFEVVKLERCLLFFPDNFEPDKEYTLIIGLHGNGGNAQNFSNLWLTLKKHNLIFAVPESPYNYSNKYGLPTDQYTWSVVSDKIELWERSDPSITKYISDIASALKSEYNISKAIILGFSQGTSFAYATGIRYNNKIDELICFGGRIASVDKYPWYLSQTELENNNNLMVYIAHGMNDMAISSYESRKSYRTLKKLGYNAHFKLFEGGHEVPDEILDEAIKWFNKN